MDSDETDLLVLGLGLGVGGKVHAADLRQVLLEVVAGHALDVVVLGQTSCRGASLEVPGKKEASVGDVKSGLGANGTRGPTYW